MRILWHSNWPEEKTGYARQTAYWVPLLASLGHEVAISAFHGMQGAPTTWQGHTVYPGGDDQFGMDVVAAHYQHFKADVLITLVDCWVADPAGVKGLNVVHWVPVDCEPMGARDLAHLRDTEGLPVAFSRHGEKMMREAGLEPRYVPHGTDTSVFTPILPRGKQLLQQRANVRDRFVIGINKANQDRNRHGFPEQFRAFAKFREKRKDAVLLVHTRAENLANGGLDLYALARECGIEAGKDLFFCDQYDYRAGMIGDEELANWYRCLDVLSMTSWGEGFGLPLIEAQACGIPVVTTRASSMTELCGAGWLADGEKFWNYTHEAWWVKPSLGSILRCYEQAYRDADKLGGRAREFALKYDTRNVLNDYWTRALDAIEERLK